MDFSKKLQLEGGNLFLEFHRLAEGIRNWSWKDFIGALVRGPEQTVGQLVHLVIPVGTSAKGMYHLEDPVT